MRRRFVKRCQSAMRLPALDPSTKCAFVNAISASVDEGGCLKKIGCAIPPAAVRPDHDCNRIMILIYCLSMIFSKTVPTFPDHARQTQNESRRRTELLHHVVLTLA